ncbi:MAG: hypothetical protein ACW99A_02840 [Candidatus Kariarchaeaceae archaeon]|jgi:hypothetical protein
MIEGKKYQRTEEIMILKNQKRTWVIFFVWYAVLLWIASLLDDPLGLGFMIGYVFSVFVKVGLDYKRDGFFTWYKTKYSAFEPMNKESSLKRDEEFENPSYRSYLPRRSENE